MSSWKGKSRGGAFGHRFFIFLINKLGIRFAYSFLLFVIIHFVPFAPAGTKANWFYFRKILQYPFFKSLKMLYVNYYRLGQILIDKVAVKSGLSNKYHYEFENYEDFLSLLNQGNGAILIGAHIGNWEIGGPFFGEYAKKMNIVMVDAEYQKIKEILEKNTMKPLHKIIPIAQDSFEHIYQIKEALDNNEYVCFQGDRFVSDKKSFTFDFLGKAAKFPAGPYYLAGKYKVPVVFYFSMREKGMKYKFWFFIADTTTKDTSGNTGHNLARQYVSVLENMLKKYPEQWFNYYKFWNE